MPDPTDASDATSFDDDASDFGGGGTYFEGSGRVYRPSQGVGVLHSALVADSMEDRKAMVKEAHVLRQLQVVIPLPLSPLAPVLSPLPLSSHCAFGAQRSQSQRERRRIHN